MMLRSIINFFKMIGIKRRYRLSHEDIYEMYELIDRHGFNEGFEIFMRGIQIKQRKQQRDKEVLIFKYKNQIFDDENNKNIKKVNKNEVFIKDFKETVEEIRKVKQLFHRERNNLKMTVHGKINGLFYSIITGEILDEPIILKHEQYLQLLDMSNKKMNELLEQHNLNVNNIRRNYSRRRSYKNDDEFNIDISHVQRAMGLDANNNNRLKDDDSDIDDILKDLF